MHDPYFTYEKTHPISCSWNTEHPTLRNASESPPPCWVPLPETLLQEVWNGAQEFAFLIIPRDAGAASGGPRWEGPDPAHSVAQCKS